MTKTINVAEAHAKILASVQDTKLAEAINSLPKLLHNDTQLMVNRLSPNEVFDLVGNGNLTRTQFTLWVLFNKNNNSK